MWGNRKEHLKYRWIHLGVGGFKQKQKCHLQIRTSCSGLMSWLGFLNRFIWTHPESDLSNVKLNTKLIENISAAFSSCKRCHHQQLLVLSPQKALSHNLTFISYFLDFVGIWIISTCTEGKKSQHECLLKVLNQWIFYHLIALRSPSCWHWQTSHWENNL